VKTESVELKKRKINGRHTGDLRQKRGKTKLLIGNKLLLLLAKHLDDCSVTLKSEQEADDKAGEGV
jgi:hypothetical protein